MDQQTAKKYLKDEVGIEQILNNQQKQEIFGLFSSDVQIGQGLDQDRVQQLMDLEGLVEVVGDSADEIEIRTPPSSYPNAELRIALKGSKGGSRIRRQVRNFVENQGLSVADTISGDPFEIIVE